MMTLKIGDQTVAIPAQLIIEAIESSFPDWMTGKRKAEGKEQLIKSGLKALLPTILAVGHAEMRKKGAIVPPPDLKCAAARENMIVYALRYILLSVMSGVDGMQFDSVTEEGPDGTLVLIRVTPADPALALAAGDIIDSRAVG